MIKKDAPFLLKRLLKLILEFNFLIYKIRCLHNKI